MSTLSKEQEVTINIIKEHIKYLKLEEDAWNKNLKDRKSNVTCSSQKIIKSLDKAIHDMQNIEMLEEKISALEEENRDLYEEIDSYENEILSLQEEIEYLNEGDKQ